MDFMDYHTYYSSHGFNISSNGMMCTGGFYDGSLEPCSNLTISPDGGYGPYSATPPGLFHVGYLNAELSGWVGSGSQYWSPH